MKRQQYVKISAGFLAAGGLMWSFKAAAIMATGDLPPQTFELGQLLFPIGALGIYLTFESPRRLDKVGLALAAFGTAAAGWLGALVALLLLPLIQSLVLMSWLWFLLGIGLSASCIEQSWLEDRPLLRGQRPISSHSRLSPRPAPNRH